MQWKSNFRTPPGLTMPVLFTRPYCFLLKSSDTGPKKFPDFQNSTRTTRTLYSKPPFFNFLSLVLDTGFYIKMKKKYKIVDLKARFLIFKFRSEPQEGKFILCHGVALHRNQLLPSFGEWIDVIHGFSSQVHTVNIDISAFSCLCALILFRTQGT